MMLASKHQAICPCDALRSVSYREQAIALRGQPLSALVFMFNGKPYSYVNHCMHMQRRLNGETDAIFNDTGRYLRCSMHGFLFDPKTGECQSPVCYGQRLQALRVEAIDGMLYFTEKHLSLIT